MIEGDIHKAVTLVTRSNIKAADIAIPKSSDRPGKHCRLLWNEECQLAKKDTEKMPGINYASSIISDTSSKQLWHRVKKVVEIYPNNGISF